MTENNTTATSQDKYIERTLRPDAPSPDAPDVSALRHADADAADIEHCPNCGATVDPDSDYCEACHSYIREDVCPFCGSHMGTDASYCPECGNPRQGITCPVCNTLNRFSFCKICGTALTAEAVRLTDELRGNGCYRQTQEEAAELARLNNILPYSSDRDDSRDTLTENLRVRVLTLLAKDSGTESPVIAPASPKRMTTEELEARKEDIKGRLTAVLEQMAAGPMVSPAKARNYAMATKPAGLRLAWVCNYRHAMHSSPYGCAKPHLGGKWVILDKNNVDQIKDDKQ